MKILEKIQALHAKNPSEQALADYILQDPYPIIAMSDKELAQQVYVSVSSIYRFCHLLGAKGFVEFKVMLAQELNANKHVVDTVNYNFPFTKQDSLPSLMNHMGNLYKNTIEETINVLDEKEILKFVQHIKNARRLYIFSTNMNAQIAENFAIKLREIGEDIIVSANTLAQRLQANALKEGDVLIVLSYAGFSTDLLEIMQIAKQNKAIILLVSSVLDRKFHHYANERILLCAKEDPIHKISCFSSHISAQFVFDILFSAIYQQHYDENCGRLPEVYGVEE